MEDNQIILRKFPEDDSTGSVGIARRIDKQGRVVIPGGIRSTLGIVSNEDSLEVYIRDDSIVLKKHWEKCVFCQNRGEVRFGDHMLCKPCVEEISRLK